MDAYFTENCPPTFHLRGRSSIEAAIKGWLKGGRSTPAPLPPQLRLVPHHSRPTPAPVPPHPPVPPRPTPVPLPSTHPTPTPVLPHAPLAPHCRLPPQSRPTLAPVSPQHSRPATTSSHAVGRATHAGTASSRAIPSRVNAMKPAATYIGDGAFAFISTRGGAGRTENT